MMPKVAIVQKYIPSYRKPFFYLLKEKLSSLNIDLVLIYGQPCKRDSMKGDSVELDIGNYVKSLIIEINEKEIYWQPILPFLKNSDLIIVEQANKLLVNYFLLLLNMLGSKQVAYWGHGQNFQATKPDSISENIKKYLTTKVHWWFAYNDTSQSVIEALGFPKDRITVVQNSIDTFSLMEGLNTLKPEKVEEVKRQLGITGNNIALFIGGMYLEKGIKFLLDSCVLVKSQIPDFEVVLIGSGPDANLVRTKAIEYPWIHYVGPKFNEEKIPYFAMARVLLLPQAVGLAILDSFALELPIITTNVRNHGPEIEYLQTNYNGVMVNRTGDLTSYSQAVVKVMQDEKFRQKLVEGCRVSKEKYSIENMVERFATGVKKAIDSKYENNHCPQLLSTTWWRR